jgi:hypothetical protein
MNNCKKTIKQSEISTTQIKLKYSASYGYSSFSNYYIASKIGINSSITITGSIPQTTLNFVSMRQLYGKNYLTGSLNNSASCWDWNQQSSAFSGSSDYEYRYFPTESNSKIGIISIPPQVFGEQVSRKTFYISPKNSTNYLIVDDGNGNLIDTRNSNIHIGNIIYSQGVILITNQNYANIFSS